MIKFEYNGKPYSIRFRYTDMSKNPFTKFDSIKSRSSMKTQCYIVSENRTTSGIALCMNTDNFSKETGRQISLEKAIRGLYSDPIYKEDYEPLINAILDAYWNRSKLSTMQRKSFSELREIRRKADVRKKIRMLERELKGLKKSIGEWT